MEWTKYRCEFPVMNKPLSLTDITGGFGRCDNPGEKVRYRAHISVKGRFVMEGYFHDKQKARDWFAHNSYILALKDRDKAIDALLELLGELRKTAALLQQNAEGCVANHYAQDFEVQGMPGWLADTAAVIQKTAAALSAAKGEESQALVERIRL